jgi:hypothetical protein
VAVNDRGSDRKAAPPASLMAASTMLKLGDQTGSKN